MKVLVAEDDRISRSILCAALKHWGYEPLAVTDGEAALAATQGPEAPRLMILDWHMPALDGLDVCRLLRKQPTEDPPYVVIVTTRGRTEDIVTGLGAGANDYLSKPYENEELRARLLAGQRVLDLQARLLEANRLLEYRATHDALTGVLARGALLEAVEREFARAAREGDVVAVGMCDLDHFKQINDCHGHQVGDQVLVGFARRLTEGLRPYDLIGRYGGEEFLVVVPQSAAAMATGLFERLRLQIAAQPVATAAGDVRLTVSIGVACSGVDGDTVTGTAATSAAGVAASAAAAAAAAAIAAADQALYAAKAAGRNQIAVAGFPCRREQAA